jgi:hypothetical protein
MNFTQLRNHILTNIVEFCSKSPRARLLDLTFRSPYLSLSAINSWNNLFVE